MRRVTRFFATLGLFVAAATASSCTWLAAGPTPGSVPYQGEQMHAGDTAGMAGIASSPGHRRAPPIPKVKPKPPVTVAGAASAVDASSVVGLSEDQVETLLGRPKSEAILPPARIREYAAGECTLRLYLYVDLKTSLYRVLHLETASARPENAGIRDCVARIAARATQAVEP